MRRIYNANGELDRAVQRQPEHSDEVLTRMTKLRMEQFSNETFRQAKQQVLRENLALAKDYAKQFE